MDKNELLCDDYLYVKIIAKFFFTSPNGYKKNIEKVALFLNKMPPY